MSRRLKVDNLAKRLLFYPLWEKPVTLIQHAFSGNKKPRQYDMVYSDISLGNNILSLADEYFGVNLTKSIQPTIVGDAALHELKTRWSQTTHTGDNRLKEKTIEQKSSPNIKLNTQTRLCFSNSLWEAKGRPSTSRAFSLVK